MSDSKKPITFNSNSILTNSSSSALPMSAVVQNVLVPENEQQQQQSMKGVEEWEKKKTATNLLSVLGQSEDDNNVTFVHEKNGNSDSDTSNASNNCVGSCSDGCNKGSSDSNSTIPSPTSTVLPPSAPPPSPNEQTSPISSSLLSSSSSIKSRTTRQIDTSHNVQQQQQQQQQLPSTKRQKENHYPPGFSAVGLLAMLLNQQESNPFLTSPSAHDAKKNNQEECEIDSHGNNSDGSCASESDTMSQSSYESNGSSNTSYDPPVIENMTFDMSDFVEDVDEISDDDGNENIKEDANDNTNSSFSTSDDDDDDDDDDERVPTPPYRARHFLQPQHQQINDESVHMPWTKSAQRRIVAWRRQQRQQKEESAKISTRRDPDRAQITTITTLPGDPISNRMGASVRDAEQNTCVNQNNVINDLLSSGSSLSGQSCEMYDDEQQQQQQQQQQLFEHHSVSLSSSSSSNSLSSASPVAVDILDKNASERFYQQQPLKNQQKVKNPFVGKKTSSSIINTNTTTLHKVIPEPEWQTLCSEHLSFSPSSSSSDNDDEEKHNNSSCWSSPSSCSFSSPSEVSVKHGERRRFTVFSKKSKHDVHENNDDKKCRKSKKQIGDRISASRERDAEEMMCVVRETMATNMIHVQDLLVKNKKLLDNIIPDLLRDHGCTSTTREQFASLYVRASKKFKKTISSTGSLVSILRKFF